MNKTKLEVIRINEDVIATSTNKQLYKMSGLGDGIANNFNLQLNGEGENLKNNFYSVNYLINGTNMFQVMECDSTDGAIMGDPSPAIIGFDGWYTFDGTTFTRKVN